MGANLNIVLNSSQEKNQLSADKLSANYFSMQLSLEEHETLRNRLWDEMRRRGFESQNAFAVFLGITPQFLGQILSGQRKGSRKLIHFAKRLKVPIGYLIGLEQLPDLLKNQVLIPLVSGRIAANPAGEIPGDAVEQQLFLPLEQMGGRKNLVAVRLGPEADSMEPSLHRGDLIIIDREDREISPRGLYAVRLPDLESCAVKKLQALPDGKHVLLISDNPAYAPAAVEWHEYLIIGRVIWSETSWLRQNT
jgi:SOS-response transcriptional repressor LexA